MVYVDGDISLFLGYEKVEFLAPVYVGDFMEYHGWIEKVGNQSYTCKFEAWKVATQLDRTDADMTGVATLSTAATACEPPVLCGRASADKGEEYAVECLSIGHGKNHSDSWHTD